MFIENIDSPQQLQTLISKIGNESDDKVLVLFGDASARVLDKRSISSDVLRAMIATGHVADAGR